jgi:hypothetical protein
VSEQERASTLMDISQYVLCDNREDIRSSIQKNAVEIALHIGLLTKPQGLNIKEIDQVLVQQLFGIRLPLKTTMSILRALEGEGKVSEVWGNYALTSKRLEEISETQKQYNASKTVMENGLLQTVKNKHFLDHRKNLTKDQEAEVLESFWFFISNYLIDRANKISKIINGENSSNNVILTSEQLSNSLGIIKDTQLKGTAKSSFIDYIENESDNFKQFLFKANQTLVCLKIMNLDPLCQKIEAAEFSKKTLFLDTNILLAIATKGNMVDDTILETLRLSQELGVKLRITEQTKKEYLIVLERSNKRQSGLQINPRILKKIDDPFLSSYGNMQERTPSLNWNDYYSKMLDPLTVLTSVQLKLEMFESGEKILELPFFEEIREKVAKCWLDSHGFEKRKEIAEHDAYHLLLIKILREKDTNPQILGPDYWFFTRDHTLEHVNREISYRANFKNRTSACIVNDVWVELIIPFLSNKLKERQASDLLVDVLKSQFITVPKGINPGVLSEIQGEWMKYQWLDMEEIEQILQKQYLSRIVKNIEKAEALGKDTTDMKSELRNKFDTEFSKLFDDKMKKMQTTISECETKIGGLQTQLNTKETELSGLTSYRETEERFKRIWRTIAGIIAIVVITVSLSVFIIRVDLSITSMTVLCTALVSSVVLLLIAVAYEQVKSVIGLGTK